jgi:gamma-glutamyltranspeptidase / glutathione hydrolase
VGAEAARSATGVVAAGDSRTAAAGAHVLSEGGNAVDAAVAAALSAFVVEPLLTSPFGGGLAMVGGIEGVGAESWDFFAEVPGRGLPPPADDPALDFKAVECSFGPTTQIFHVGRGSVAVPLLLPGLVALWRRHGRLPLEAVVAPAHALAVGGIALSPAMSPIFGILDPILRHTPDVATLFAPGGRTLGAGDHFENPDLARLLESVGRGDLSGGRHGLADAFGPPAGRITDADLDAADVRHGAPLRVAVRDHEIDLPPPPASGGVLVAFGLKLLEGAPASAFEDETRLATLLFAAMATTNAARREGLDEALRTEPRDALVDRFLGADHVARWRPYFERAAAAGLPDGPMPPSPDDALGSTTHVSVLDAEGRACAITHSNGEGAGHLVPGAGAMANNFLGEEDLHPAGFHRSPPGTRLTSMMCPTVVTKGGRAEIALGTGGSNRIRSAILQVLVHHLFRRAGIEASVGAPRMHLEGRSLYVERNGTFGAFSAATLRALEARVDELIVFDAPSVFFGGVHAVALGDEAAGDPRRGGAVCRG